MSSEIRTEYLCRRVPTDNTFIVQEYYASDRRNNKFVMHTRLRHLPLWERIGPAWRYLMGRSSGGEFSEIDLDREQVKRLRDDCNRFLKRTPEIQEGLK